MFYELLLNLVLNHYRVYKYR